MFGSDQMQPLVLKGDFILLTDYTLHDAPSETFKV